MMELGSRNDSNRSLNSRDNNMNSIGLGSVGLSLPVTSGIDPNVAISPGIISVPCSVGDVVVQQQTNMQAQPQHIQIPGTAMSLGSLAVAMGLPGANTDPNNLTFTSNALASLAARMGMSTMASSNPCGIVAAANSLMTFPGNTTLNIVPGVAMNPAGVSIVDGSQLSMTVAGGMAMQAPSNINVMGVQASNDMTNANSIINQQQQQQGHSGGAILQNNVHINAGGSLVNNMGVAMTGVSSSVHTSGGCCGGCRTRVTVKDQSSQTDLSTVIQVKAEERLARSGLMPGARLISHSAGTTVSHATPNSHHGPNYPCSCDFCGRMFAKKEYLRRHIRIHTGERPYKCVICGHSFRRSHHLRCHELTHTGTKPYSCGICGKAFNLSHHLRRHEMTHTGEKPYACTECGKAFTRKQHLDRHYKTHTGEYHRTFKCPFCEKMFFRAHHRDKHMKRHGKVLTTPDLAAANFSPVNNMNLSMRADGTLRADGFSASPISVASKDNSHSSEDYLTSDEEGKVPNSNKPKEGSKKRKGTSPMRLRFPYDYNIKEGPDGMKPQNMDLSVMKNLPFPLPQSGSGPSHIPGLPTQTNTILTTPTRGRPRGSKNRGGGSARGRKKEDRGDLMNQLGLEMKSERMDMDRESFGGMTGIKKDAEMIGGNVYGGKPIIGIPQQFVSESVVVRHPLQVASPHTMGQQQISGHVSDKGMSIKPDESNAGSVPTPTPTSTPDGRGPPIQWQHQQQVVLNSSGGGGSGNDYMPGMNRQLHTPGPAAATNNNNNGTTGDIQQTMHYKPSSTPDQNLHNSWPVATNWPRISLSSEQGTNSYNQVDASRFMNIYSASKVVEMRMADLRAQQNFDANLWNQGRRDQGQDKGDNRIYNMHQ